MSKNAAAKAKDRWRREYRAWLDLSAKGSHLAPAAWVDVRRAEAAVKRAGGEITDRDVEAVYNRG